MAGLRPRWSVNARVEKGPRPVYFLNQERDLAEVRMGVNERPEQHEKVRTVTPEIFLADRLWEALALIAVRV